MNNHDVKAKEKERQEIAQQMKEYEDRGGKVTEYDTADFKPANYAYFDLKGY